MYRRPMPRWATRLAGAGATLIVALLWALARSAT